MSKWKLARQTYGGEVISLSEGDEITIGRGVNNTITLSSLVISRRHCIIKAFKDKVTVQDLKSSNGTYVDSNKIEAHSTCTVREAGVIGVGWMEGAGLAKIADAEKFVFKLLKEKTEKSISDRIAFQNESEIDEVEDKLAAYISGLENDQSEIKPLITDNKNENKPSIKRKCSSEEKAVLVKEECVVEPSGNKINEVVIDLVSESENENESNNNDEEVPHKKIKLEIIHEEIPAENLETIKTEVNENTDYDAFKVKQELLGYDEEPINLDSDSETESERRWLFRLSQSSPGKPLKNPILIEENNHIQESSYSQIIEDHDESLLGEQGQTEDSINEEFLDDLIIIPEKPLPVTNNFTPHVDEVDGCTGGLSSDFFAKQLNKLPEPETDKEACARTTAAAAAAVEALIDSIGKKAQMIEPQTHSSRGKSHSLTTKKVEKSSVQPSQSKPKSTSSKHSKSKKHSHPDSKRHISNSQKEERKKKLKEIAFKEKDPEERPASNSASSSKTKVKVKITNSNRGAFLTETTATVNPVKQKESLEKSHKHLDKEPDTKKPDYKEPISNHVSTSDTNEEKCQNIENMRSVDQSNVDENACKTPKRKSRCNEKRNSRSTDNSKKCDNKSVKKTETRVPLKNLKPLTDSEDANSGKPTSKVEPMTVTKPKKRVRFSDAPPQVNYFEIEPGNQMKKTSLVKATQLDVPQKPLFSLEKITLMKILRWNPQWLDEQVNNNEPPPILGHNFPPMTLMYSFQSHDQYVQVVGDLLLMELWEAITQAFMRKRNFQDNIVQMSIESLPSSPALDRGYEIFPVSVNVSVPKTGVKHLPRLGELMLVWFGPDNAKSSRFFFVHNIKTLPSPPNNMYSYFSITLHTMYTDKMRALRQGEVMHGRILCYIRNELSLFEAMEYLSRSPLCEMILRPDPKHFQREQHIATQHIKSPWTETLNESQLEAVSCSVRSALSERPSIQMIQGPPGTGKSSVICSIIMTYFYDTRGLRLQGRGKILICATSNAAVDELVIRLLHIRQSLPKTERFRMVRVGRPEAMHSKARDLSSQSLAQRDAQRLHHDPAATTPRLDEEIARAEARLNMWISNISEAKDPARVAYCQTQLDQIKIRLMQLRGGSTGEVSNEQLALAERRIVEGADIIVTTLSSAANHKMKGLKRRIALCIVDEAGQAIEPETLIPLMLDVTRITLIGDPQQLPGFIGSQRAKQHGLGESLFSRLSSSMEHWTERSPVVLLNTQYRMHPVIADYPNRAFYDGKIRNAVNVRTDLVLPSYSVIYITSGDKGQAVGGGNEMEAWGVARMVVALSVLTRQYSMSLAVITPYNAHKELIKKILRTLQDPSTPAVEVNTVDSFQGQERDVVVVSIARSQGAGFLNEAGRMNVMLTRAKHSLLICLNPNALTRNQQWRTLVDDAHKRCLLKYLPNKCCQPTTAANLANDNILQYITKSS